MTEKNRRARWLVPALVGAWYVPCAVYLAVFCLEDGRWCDAAPAAVRLLPLGPGLTAGWLLTEPFDLPHLRPISTAVTLTFVVGSIVTGLRSRRWAVGTLAVVVVLAGLNARFAVAILLT